MLINYLLTGCYVQSDHIINDQPAVSVPPDHVPDVIVETLDIAHKTAPKKTVSGTTFSCSVEDGLKYSIRDGNRITIYRGPDISDQQVSLFLLGSAWGVLCHQRSKFPLHCSSVSFGEQAFAFVAESGGGKSTLAASLCNSDIRHVCDDVAIVDTDCLDRLTVHAMPKGLKLWREASEILGLEQQALVAANDSREKHYVKAPEGPEQSLLDLTAIYEIHFSDADDTPCIQQVTGIDAIKTVYRNTYLVDWLNLLDISDRVLAQSRIVASRIPIFRYTRPRDLETLKASSAFLKTHMQDLRDKKS